MLQRSKCCWLRASCSLLQGGWGSASSAGHWSTPRASASGAANAGGWGSYSDTSSTDDGWGCASRGRGGGGGGWGSDARGGRRGGADGSSGWGGGGGGWRAAPPSSSYGGGRAGRARGGGGWGSDHAGGGGGWGQTAPRHGAETTDAAAAAATSAAWGAAPPSFTPPVRRVDPLTLTAVEVEIDGVKKLVGQRVQISGLSEDTSWQTLKDHLRQVAEVTFCKLYSGGRAMVEFATPDDAARAITELQASELDGATLFMREDREDIVLVNTRRKIREVREAQLRARKVDAEKQRREAALAQGDRAEHAGTVASPTVASL